MRPRTREEIFINPYTFNKGDRVYMTDKLDIIPMGGNWPERNSPHESIGTVSGVMERRNDDGSPYQDVTVYWDNGHKRSYTNYALEPAIDPIDVYLPDDLFTIEV